MRNTLRSRAAHLRAALLLVVIAAQGLLAAPLPHVVTPRELRDPVAAEELAAWGRRLRSLGLPWTDEELGDLVVTWTERIGGAHRELTRPLKPVSRWTGTGQGWALFANPDTHPRRLEVAVRREEGPPQLIFRRLDPDFPWLADQLAFRRVRGVYDSPGSRRTWRHFCDWVGRRALDADPAVSEVEVRLVRGHTTLPGQPRDPSTKVVHVRRVRREGAP